jgi:quercetin dioxygenase-like cupin family protein
MNSDRRALLISLPILMASRAMVDSGPDLTSGFYPFESLPVHHSGGNTSRAVLNGLTHEGCNIEVHETDLAPGSRPHPPHHHQNEEMFLIRQGTVEVTINGKSSRLGPGSVAFIASNDEHGIRNAGNDHAKYFVLAIS